MHRACLSTTTTRTRSSDWTDQLMEQVNLDTKTSSVGIIFEYCYDVLQVKLLQGSVTLSEGIVEFGQSE